MDAAVGNPKAYVQAKAGQSSFSSPSDTSTLLRRLSLVRRAK
jgi:hypothetical protein